MIDKSKLCFDIFPRDYQKEASTGENKLQDNITLYFVKHILTTRKIAHNFPPSSVNIQ